MEDNKKSLFRKKSIELIESPEVLDQYLRVTSTGVWVIFGAVIAILIGAFVWAIFGTIQSKTNVAVVIDQDNQCVYVPQEALQAVIADRVMLIDGNEVELSPKSIEPVMVDEGWDVYIMIAGGLSAGDIVYPIPVASPMEEGIYTGTIVTETISPISFLLN